MRNLWILTRFLLKSGPGKSNQKSGKKKAFSDGGRIVVYLLLGVCLLPVSVLLFLLGYSGYTFLQPLGLETLLIEFVCAIGMMVIFFYGLPLFLSEYYMDSDLVKLLPLPFTPAQIVGAKGFCCLLNEYYLIVLLFFPFLLGYGISAKMGIFYWINMILACLIFPVVPLVYAAVLTMLVMRLFKNIRNKDFLSYLGFAASLIFAIGINVFSRSIGNFEMQDIMNLMESQKGTLRAFRTIFPNLPLMTGSLADASFLKMILYIATTAAIKSNNRSLISVLIDLTVGAILIGAGYLLYGKLHLNIHITTSVMILLTAVLTFAMRTALFKWGVQVMEHLESA